MNNNIEIPAPIKHDMEKLGGIPGLAKQIPPEKQVDELSKIFKAVADKYRLNILLILNEQPVCVCIIKEILGISDSKLSYHLATLKDNGLIYGKQLGNWIIYYPTKIGKTMAKFILNTGT